MQSNVKDKNVPSTLLMWIAVASMLVLVALIGYVGYEMVVHLDNPHAEVALAFVIFFLLIALVLVISYIADADSIHDWLNGENEDSLSSKPHTPHTLMNRKRSNKNIEWPSPKSCVCGGKECNCN